MNDPLLDAIPDAPAKPAADPLMDALPAASQQPVDKLLTAIPSVSPAQVNDPSYFAPLSVKQAFEQSSGTAPTLATQIATERGTLGKGPAKVPEELPPTNWDPMSMPFVTGAAKAAGRTLSLGAYNPPIQPQERGGAVVGGAGASLAPLALTPIAPELTVPAMVAMQGLPATAGNVDAATGAPKDPAQSAIDVGFSLALAELPPAVGKAFLTRAASGAGIGALQSAVQQMVAAKAAGGQIDPNDPRAIQDLAQQAIMGTLFGGLRSPGNEAPRPPAEPVKPEAQPAAAKPPAPSQPAPKDQGTPGQNSFFGDPYAPGEDLQNLQWQKGNAAAMGVREAELAREQALQQHEAAVRAAIDAENKLRDKYPDPEVSPPYPAARDEMRQLTQQSQAADARETDARKALDESNAALLEAQRKASQAVPVDAVGNLSGPQLEGRKSLETALKDAGLSAPQSELAMRVADRNPAFYDKIQTLAADPAELHKALFGDNVSRETPKLDALFQDSEINRRASEDYRRMVGLMQPTPSGEAGGDRYSHEHQLSYELDFGAGSPWSQKFPEFSNLPYERKAEITHSVLDDAAKFAQQASGLHGVQFYGPGGWGEHPMQPSGQMHVDAPIEKVRDMARMLGYLAQQDAVYISRPNSEGAKVGIDIRGPSEFFSKPENVQKFWDALRQAAPDIATGFHPIDGGIRIGREEGPAAIPALQEKFAPAIQAVADKFGLDLNPDFVRIDGELVSSPWKENPNGEGYLGPLGQTHGPAIQARLDRFRGALEQRLQSHLRGEDSQPAAEVPQQPAAHGRGERNGSGLADRFGIDPERLAANSPDAAQSVYRALGNKVEPRNTGADLKIYPLESLTPDKLNAWLKERGWNYKVFGPDQATGKFIPPDFKNYSYDNKHVWIFSPWTEHGSFKDAEYTRNWRVTHEIAHGQTNDALTQKYGGVGRRQGALGRETEFNGRKVPPLSLADAMRAVEWEHETFKRQREILEKELGIKITDEQFKKENATNMSDALYRALTGDFSNPGDLGLVPSTMNPDQMLARAKDILRTAAKDQDIDMSETFGKGVAQSEGRDIKGAFIPGDATHRAFLYMVRGKADLSTFLHEHAHGVLESMLRDNPQFKNDLATVNKWISSVDAEAIKPDGSWTTAAKETFARGVERYFHDGKTDIPEMKPVFERIKAWMQKIYASLLGSPIARAIPEDVRQVMDRLLGYKGEVPKEVPAKAPPEGLVGERNAAGSPTPPSQPGPRRSEALSVQDVSANPKSTSSAPAAQGERSLPNTLEEHGLPGGTNRNYQPKSNADTMAKVSAELDKKGLDQAAHEILAKDKPSAEQTAKAITIMRRWQHEADAMPEGPEKAAVLEKTVNLATEMSKRLTNLGQAIQAVRVIENLSPDGVVFYAQRRLNALNEQRAPNRQIPPVSPAAAQELRAASKTLERENAFTEEAKKIATIADKMGGKEKLANTDIEALKAFRDRMVEYLGDKPQRVQRGVMRPNARPPKAQEDINAMLESRQAAALQRLAQKGLQPSKALFQANTKLGDSEIEDLADVFAARLSRRGDKSVSAIKQSFKDSFGQEIAPYMDRVAQRGAQKLSKARGDRARLSQLVQRVDEILAPLTESGDAGNVAEAEKLRGSLQELRNLTGDAKLEASQDLQAALQALVPSSLGQKVNSVQTIAQLLNPKTIVRNLIGNEVFYHLDRLSKWVASPIDYARSKLTGEDRQITFRSENQGGYWKALMTGASAAARGVNPEGLESKYDLQAPAFKSKYNPFTYMERAMGMALRATDYAAYTRAKNNTLGELAGLAADRINVPAGSRKKFVENWIRNADDRAMEIADAYGKYVTFNDDTKLAQAMSAVKRGANKLTYLGTVDKPKWGLGDLIIKYPKTPANIFMRAVDYSPAGFVKSMYMLAKPILTGEAGNAREMELALSRAIVGTLGLTGLGYYLANHGVISGEAEKDKDTREFLANQTGQRNFQVNTSALKRWVFSGFSDKALARQNGDILMSYDWAQPMAINLAMAATANQMIGDKKHPVQGALNALGAGAQAGVQALQEQPFLQGVSQLFGNDKNSNIAEKLSGILEDAPASFVPSVVNQVKQLMDNTKRETRAPTMLQRTLNKIIYKLPFFSETLPAAYNTIGIDAKKEMYQNASNDLWNVFVNPAFIEKYHLDPQIAAIIGPYEAEGRTQQFPYSAPKKLQYTEGREKKSLELDGADYSALQKMMAENSIRAFQGLDYAQLAAKSPEHQEKELASRMKEAWEQSRVRFLKSKDIHFNVR